MLNKRYISVPTQTPETSAGQEITPPNYNSNEKLGNNIFSQGVILIWKEFFTQIKKMTS